MERGGNVPVCLVYLDLALVRVEEAIVGRVNSVPLPTRQRICAIGH